MHIVKQKINILIQCSIILYCRNNNKNWFLIIIVKGDDFNISDQSVTVMIIGMHVAKWLCSLDLYSVLLPVPTVLKRNFNIIF